jgi:solute carrier family 35 protein F5
MLLTTPLIVTVGLSLTIPLALLGQMLLHQNSPKFLYWVGAALVLVAFLFINNESETLDAVIESEATGEFTVEHDRID